MKNTMIDTISIANVAIISGLAYIWIDKTIFLLYCWLLLADYITWMMKWVVHRSLCSKTAVIWIVWKVSILIMVLSLWVMLKINDFWFANNVLAWVFTALALAELYSIIWNVYEIITKKKAPEFDALTKIMNWFLNNIKIAIEKITTTRIDYNEKNKDKDIDEE